MPRLYRPYIPVEVRCRVVLRQLGELWPDDVISAWTKDRLGGRLGSLQALLDDRLEKLAALLGCTKKELRLDHDPALAARQRWGEGKTTVYLPAANDPEFLIYRTAHGHHLKTNVRGDGAQYPDRVLIKRERKRREAKERKICRRCQRNYAPAGKRLCDRCMKVARKLKWGSRPLRSASRWPAKGSRKIGERQ
jgi:hypothetical protein